MIGAMIEPLMSHDRIARWRAPEGSLVSPSIFACVCKENWPLALINKGVDAINLDCLSVNDANQRQALQAEMITLVAST